MSTPEQPPQEQDAEGLIPALLTIYLTYQAYRSAHGTIPPDWQDVVTKLQLPSLVEDQLAMIAARGLARQREGLGPGADELWPAVPVGIQSGIDAGMQTIAEALIWTEDHDELSTKDEADGIIPTLANPPVELALTVAQAVAAAAQESTATEAGWRYKTWQTVGDAQVRTTHAELKGKKIPIGASFKTIDGDELRYPGDPNADISNRIGCRCHLSTSR